MIYAATAWPTNADLIHDCAQLGYLQRDWLTLDPTYGRGKWWTRFHPERLVTADIDPTSPAEIQADFRRLPFRPETFQAIAYDPPYVCVGGRKTTGLPDYHDRYGMDDAPRTPLELQRLISEGIRELETLLAPRGFLLVKCQDYISSGKLWTGVFNTQWSGICSGLEPVDVLHHISGGRPQPPGRRQVHARRNLSTLLVFRKAAR